MCQKKTFPNFSSGEFVMSESGKRIGGVLTPNVPLEQKQVVNIEVFPIVFIMQKQLRSLLHHSCQVCTFALLINNVKATLSKTELHTQKL